MPLWLQGQNIADNDSTYKNFFLPAPSMTYSPETDFVFRVYGLYQFKFKKEQADVGFGKETQGVYITFGEAF